MWGMFPPGCEGTVVRRWLRDKGGGGGTEGTCTTVTIALLACCSTSLLEETNLPRYRRLHHKFWFGELSIWCLSPLMSSGRTMRSKCSIMQVSCGLFVACA